jgi:Fe-S-cluster containining protein
VKGLVAGFSLLIYGLGDLEIKGCLLHMRMPELMPIGLDETFRFACHGRVACFNHCCRDLNQALTPYDVLCLKRHLNLSSREFFETYALVYAGSATGLPVASLRFSNDEARQCPFVTPAGCKVYAARPSSCRIYPLARALSRNRSDGRTHVRYALLRESHCRGFNEPKTQTVRQWLEQQQLENHLAMNDALMELIALKNQIRPGPLAPEHLQMVQTAFYDPETLQYKARRGELPELNHSDLIPLPDKEHHEHWLKWSLQWVGHALFGRCLTM